MTEQVEKTHDVDYADPEEEKQGTFENKVSLITLLIIHNQLGRLAHCFQQDWGGKRRVYFQDEMQTLQIP